MGTDIHLAVERRDTTTGKWYVVPPTAALQTAARAEYERWLNPESKDAGMRQWAQAKVERNWYDDRNYETFAMLADVRNARGFAGVDTGDGFTPIAQPRGLPLDMSDELRVPANYYAMRECGWANVPDDLPVTDDDDDDDDRGFWLGDHSFSYFTVRELQAYDWTQTTKLRGVITLDEFIKREEDGATGPPATYCGGVSGQRIVTWPMERAKAVLAEHGAAKLREMYDCGGFGRWGVSAEAARELNASIGRVAIADDPRPLIYVRVQWEETYAEAAGQFYSDMLPELASLDPEHPDDVRIVFGFDS
jgi:hypothetical protein